VFAHLFGSGSIPLDATWRAGYDAELTSNDKYLKAYDISSLDRLTSDLFLEGTNGRSRFAITGYFFQGLRVASCPTAGPCLPADDNRTFPVPLPLIEYNYIPEGKLAGGQFRLDVNAVALSRQGDAIALTSPLPFTPSGCVPLATLSVQCESDQRLSTRVSWRLPFVTGDGELFTFEASARGDVYHINNPQLLSSTSHFIARGLPYMALDWRWPFIAAGGSAGRSYLIEPIAQVVVAPYGGNPKALVALNEDSAGLELDENNLFSFDQMPGYDLVESGPRANVGVRAEAHFATGYVEALLGESLRPKPDPIFASDPTLSGTTSDLVGRFSIKFPPFLDLTHRIDIDEKSGTVRRNEVYLTGTHGRSSLQVSYAQLAASALTAGLPARQEVNAQANINFYENWQAFAAARRDLDAGKMLDSEYGLGYEDECFGMGLVYRRRFTSQLGLPPSTSIILRLQLKSGDETVAPSSLFPQEVFSYVHP
jgi:LPS-assembly protein